MAGFARTGPRSERRRSWLRPALWLALGAWIGSSALFGAVVAPAAFRLLPSSELAGDLVAGVLPALYGAGAVGGVLLAVLAAALGRGRLAVALPLALAAASLVNHFGVSPPLAEIRLGDPALAQDAELARRFARLHRLSVALFLATAVGAVALAGLHWRAELRESGRSRE